MNFNGQIRRGRNINLGNKKQTSRNELLEQAKQQRLDREQLRLRTTAVQKFQRGLRAQFRRRTQQRAARDGYIKALRLGHAHQLSAEQYIMDFIYFSPVLFEKGPETAQLLVAALASIGNSNGLANTGRIVSKALDTVWAHDPIEPAVIKEAVGVFANLPPPYSSTTPKAIVQFIVRAPPALAEDLNTFIEHIIFVLATHHPNETLDAVLSSTPVLKSVSLQSLSPLFMHQPDHMALSIHPRKALAELVRVLAPSAGQALPLLMSLVSVITTSGGRLSQEILHILSSLYSKAFVLEIVEAQPQPPVLAGFLLALLTANPHRKTELLMHLSLTGSQPLLHQFWNHFKNSTTCALALQLPGSVGKLVDSSDWTVLEIALELFSYWLVVSNDSEFLSNSKQGLPLEDICIVSEVLRNLCFTLIWETPEIPRLLAAKAVMLTTIRQIYVRDSRREFLPERFWLMDQYMGSGSMEQITEESLKDDIEFGYNDDDEDTDDEDEDEGRGRIVIKPQSPRLAVLREVPFFIPFRTRVAIFSGFTRQSKINLRSRDPQDFFFLTTPDQHYTINRESLLDDARSVFAQLGPNLKHKLRVQFFSNDMPEAGIDGGGLTKEILTAICSEVFGPDAVDPYNSLFIESVGHTLYPNPAYGLSSNNQNMGLIRDMYIFLGQTIAKCLYENLMVDVEFAAFFLQKWAGSAATKSSFDDLYLMDPAIYNSLIKLYEYEGDVEDMGLDFTVPGSDELIELKPNGSQIAVTNANKLEYIYAVANYKLNTVLGPQSKWFLKGMSDVISLSWLKMFNPTEIQTLISGKSQDIDVDDLMANSVSHGFLSSNSLRDFWKVVREMTPKQRSQLLKFVTSVPKGPLLGFNRLTPKFGIRSAGRNDDWLPTASTCTNLLKLPEYSNIEILRRKLLQSIESNAGFDLS